MSSNIKGRATEMGTTWVEETILLSSLKYVLSLKAKVMTVYGRILSALQYMTAVTQNGKN